MKMMESDLETSLSLIDMLDRDIKTMLNTMEQNIKQKIRMN